MKILPLNLNIEKISKQPNYNLAFSGNIIDSHVHTGRWQSANYGAEALDIFVKEPLNINVNAVKQSDVVEKMLVSNLSCIEGNGLLDETAGNTEIINICKKNPKLYPLAVCQPGKTDGDASAIRKLLEENEGKFVGLKFHPKSLPLAANDLKYDNYLKLAEEKKLPCLFHSQVNIDSIPKVVEDVSKWDNSDPEFIYQLAKRHKNVPVIMGHTGAGGSLAHEKAIEVLVKSIENNDAKLYCDISWVDFENNLPVDNPKSLISLIEKLKNKDALDRILFGTDSALGCYGGELARDGQGNIIPAKEAYERTVSTFKTAIKQNFGEDADNIIQKIFYDNADELFFKKKWAEGLSESLSAPVKNKTKMGFLFCGAALAFTGVGLFISSKIKKGKDNKVPSESNNTLQNALDMNSFIKSTAV